MDKNVILLLILLAGLPKNFPEAWKGIKINKMLHLPEKKRERTGKGLANPCSRKKIRKRFMLILGKKPNENFQLMV
jgi:hypothetical protein